MLSPNHKDAPLTPERRTELQLMLYKMTELSNEFYRKAIQQHCHPFIEFTGFMTEYIRMCQGALDQGIDFANASEHSSTVIPLRDYQIQYITEKFRCIFGPSFRAHPDALKIFAQVMGLRDDCP